MNKNTIGLLSFVALLISGFVYLLRFFNVGGGILPVISDGILLFVVLVMAWEYVKGLSNAWKTVYYVLAVLAIIGFVFGGIGINL
jgi:vacuolar-type H+-ATPase subunit I/STV1